MNRFIAGILASMLMMTGGLLWWQSRAESERQPLAQQSYAPPALEDLPAGDENAFGAAPPAPQASPKDRESRRFARYDRDRNGIITRVEMMSSRTKDFKKLDSDGNNLLSFEEWADKTSDKFSGADTNQDGKLTPAEFATTAPKPKKSRCAC